MKDSSELTKDASTQKKEKKKKQEEKEKEEKGEKEKKEQKEEKERKQSGDWVLCALCKHNELKVYWSYKVRRSVSSHIHTSVLERLSILGHHNAAPTLRFHMNE